MFNRIVGIAAFIAMAAAVMPPLAQQARATTPGYVGTWGVDGAQCDKEQDVEGAPIVFSANGYDQHETHCTFTSIKPSPTGWKVEAACVVEGDTQTDAFTLAADGDVLIMAREQSALRLKRCD